MPARETTLSVPDMRCEGCTERVTNVLKRLKGVRSADVSLEDRDGNGRAGGRRSQSPSEA